MFASDEKAFKSIAVVVGDGGGSFERKVASDHSRRYE